VSLDHGELNLPLHKRGGGSLDSQIDRHLRAQAKRKREDYKAQRAAATQAEAQRVRFTAEELRGAVMVRTSWGWHKVVRVSSKSVTVETGYSWTDRIDVDKILEFRGAA
jgi:hypothetical protein